MFLSKKDTVSRAYEGLQTTLKGTFNGFPTGGNLALGWLPYMAFLIAAISNGDDYS